MLDYLRMVKYHLTEYEPQPPYYLTGWDKIRVTDGPVHTVYGWWLALTCNWLSLGAKCAYKGHNWRDETITVAPEKEMYPKAPGVLGFRLTGRRVAHKVRVCSRCGSYRGSFKQPLDDPRDV